MDSTRTRQRMDSSSLKDHEIRELVNEITNQIQTRTIFSFFKTLHPYTKEEFTIQELGCLREVISSIIVGYFNKNNLRISNKNNNEDSISKS